MFSRLCRNILFGKAASFFSLLELGVKKAADDKYGGAVGRDAEKKKYIDSFNSVIATKPLDVASEIHFQMSNGFRSWLTTECRNLQVRNHKPASALKHLQRLGAVLLTTNYDLLLENVKSPHRLQTPGSNRGMDMLDSSDAQVAEVQDVLLGNDQGILHLFGIYRRECLVFTKSDHEAYPSDHMMEHLSCLLYQYHILFVGFSRNDPFLATLYRVMNTKKIKNRHYILVQDTDLERFSETFVGMLPVRFGKTQDDLTNFLNKIMDSTNEHQKGQKRRMDDVEGK